MAESIVNRLVNSFLEINLTYYFPVALLDISRLIRAALCNLVTKKNQNNYINKPTPNLMSTK